MDINIDSKIELWKNKLLDLGKRNRLISYHETKRSTLSILKPSLFDLWESLVKNEKPIEFPYCDDTEEDFENNDNKEIICNDRDCVITNQDLLNLQKTLRNLRNKARTAAGEQGIHILHLAFGFLKWKESESSESYIYSPLILVPVNLTVKSISSPYIMELADDEIVFNPALKYKLENDFGLSFPEFNEDTDIEEYLKLISNIIKVNKWKVELRTELSLFSFLKINMYHDLIQHKEEIASNPNIRAICGDCSCVSSIPEELDDYDFDKKDKPVDMFQIVDADSSQQEAILLAKMGVSFVMQGPPGTGKSQTITNIIAQCLADGKKVLFVSEKMAALDVVYRRLTTAELNDFCLVLHSYKANKKAVLEQLRTVLNFSKTKAQLSDEAYIHLDTLYNDREKLNNYADQLFKNVEPLNKSIYEVNGILANLEDYNEIIFDVQNIRNVSNEKYNRFIYTLNQFKNTIGSLTKDYSSNPWKNANVQYVTNELRHDIKAKFPEIKKLISSNYEIISQIVSEIFPGAKASYLHVEKVIEVLKFAKTSPQLPSTWLIGEDLSRLEEMAKNYASLKQQFLKNLERLENNYTNISRVYDFNFQPINYYDYDLEKINNDIKIIEETLSKDLIFSKLNQAKNIDKICELSRLAEEKAITIKNLQKEILNNFEKEILDLDYKPILNRFKTEYGSIFKYFKPGYREDIKLIKKNLKSITERLDDNKIIDVLQSLNEINNLKDDYILNFNDFTDIFGKEISLENIDFVVCQNQLTAYVNLKNSINILTEITKILDMYNAQEAKLSSKFEFLYNGISTKWEDVFEKLSWAKEFNSKFGNSNIGREFRKRISDNTSYIQKCYENEEEISSFVENIKDNFEWLSNLFDNHVCFQELELMELNQKIDDCLNNLFLLEEWIDFRRAKKECLDEGLYEYIDKVEAMHLDKELIVPVFQKRFFRLWLDSVMPEYPAVMDFRRLNQENLLKEFKALDTMQFEIAKARIKSKLINDLPVFDKISSGLDEVGILRRELSKQRQIMPIRKLFRKIPNLLLTLKPCLMMSPLSVSLFLEAGSYKFDTVIFDEASQVMTENAIGAIFRGKQVIIAGDSKQLPPTNFFTASVSESDYDVDDEDDDNIIEDDAYESILDEANLLPEKTLLWHYRSRHEHLIAFSNAKIYHNNLITFPSNVDKAKDTGVEYVYVQDGFYDRGGKRGNILEAQKVAELVFEHFKKYPNRTLGVVAFGEVQQQAIETQIRKMRMKYQGFEPFFNEENDEPFFVKNLENVQGDERDTIIFSIGYAKDSNGVFRMNFGPLSKSGGERRLNVAITRAKYNVKLVGSIMPTEIDIDRISSEGPKLLRSYIDFAINGVSVLNQEITESDIVETDSPFEDAVYNFLDRKGYKLATQVGCSGYRIDMAIKHPTISGQYVLGIECDGATYHSAKTARDRDRLRQDVLENMGWKIYRIWSTDWIKDPITEGKRLIDTIEDAIKSYSISEESYHVDNEQETKDFINFEERSILADNVDNPYNFEEQPKVCFENLERNENGNLNATDCIMEIVKKLYPVHFDLICKELAPLCGYERVSSSIRESIYNEIEKMKDNLTCKDNFYSPIGDIKVVPRKNNDRKIDYVSEEELGVAMLTVLRQSIGITRDILITETARSYNYFRLTQKISDKLNKVFDMLLENGKVEIRDGKVV